MVITAVCGFGALTPVTEDSSEPVWPALVASMASIVDFTSAEVNVEPSANLTPCRRVNVVARPLAETCHDVASHGMIAPGGVLPDQRIVQVAGDREGVEVRGLPGVDVGRSQPGIDQAYRRRGPTAVGGARSGRTRRVRRGAGGKSDAARYGQPEGGQAATAEEDAVASAEPAVWLSPARDPESPSSL